MFGQILRSVVAARARISTFRVLSLVCVVLLTGTCGALEVGVRGFPAAKGTAGPSQASGDGGPDQSAIHEAIAWIQQKPRIRTSYDYVMTARVRLLFFWVGKDDVGGGYIRMGEAADDPHLQIIQLLFGSDPAKAPRNVNRWGAGTEVLRRTDRAGEKTDSSAFMGFMKASKGDSPAAMQRELSAESKAGQHLFEAIISRVDRGRAVSTTVPFYSNQDFDLHELTQAESLAMERLADDPAAGKDRKIHGLRGSSQLRCDRASGFLSTVLELMDHAQAGTKVPASLCYVYNAHEYAATLLGTTAVAQKTVRVVRRDKAPPIGRTYHNLKDARFQIHRLDTDKRYNFDILLGTEGPLQGVPVQINYQPNWWFQVVLNLENQVSQSQVRSR